MIERKFPNRSFFPLLIYSPHPSATRYYWHILCVQKKMDRRVFDYRQIVSFLFTFCPLAYLADLRYVWKETNYFRVICLGSVHLFVTFGLSFSVCKYPPPPPLPLFCSLCVSQQRGITDTFCVCKKKYCTGGRLRFWTVRKFPFHLLSSCLSSWSQPRLPFCDMRLTTFLVWMCGPSTTSFDRHDST
jgi:hypothetical protein